jgi:hypothetical protein
MATATKEARTGIAAGDAAVTQVTDSVVNATAAATDMFHRAADAFAPVVKSAEARMAELAETVSAEMKKAEASTKDMLTTFTEELKGAEVKTQELTAVYADEIKKVEAAGREWTETFSSQVSDWTARSFDSYQVAVERSLSATISFAEAMKIEWITDLTRRNAKVMTDLVDASVSQAGGLLK